MWLPPLLQVFNGYGLLHPSVRCDDRFSRPADIFARRWAGLTKYGDKCRSQRRLETYADAVDTQRISFSKAFVFL